MLELINNFWDSLALQRPSVTFQLSFHIEGMLTLLSVKTQKFFLLAFPIAESPVCPVTIF